MEEIDRRHNQSSTHTFEHVFGGSLRLPIQRSPPVVLQARFAWWRAGTVSASANGTALTLAPYGVAPITLRGFGTTAPLPSKLTGGLGFCSHANTSQACIAFALDARAPVAFTTAAHAASAAATVSAIGKHKQVTTRALAMDTPLSLAVEALCGTALLSPASPVSKLGLGRDLCVV